jgi:hypothetical protein
MQQGDHMMNYHSIGKHFGKTFIWGRMFYAEHVISSHLNLDFVPYNLSQRMNQPYLDITHRFIK